MDSLNQNFNHECQSFYMLKMTFASKHPKEERGRVIVHQLYKIPKSCVN